MGRVVTAFVPFLPLSVLSPNRGERRGGRVPEDISDAKRQLRGDWALWLLEHDAVRAVQQPFERARVTLTMRCQDAHAVRPSDGVYRPTDVGNAVYALKAGIDGLIDAGLIIDDDWRHVPELVGRIERVYDRASEGVLVEVEELEADD